MRYQALACVYDGTLAHDGQVSEETVARLRRLVDSTARRCWSPAASWRTWLVAGPSSSGRSNLVTGQPARSRALLRQAVERRYTTPA